MPVIQFDVLASPAVAADIGTAFQHALDILVRHGKLVSGDVRADGVVEVDASVAAQLASTYEHDRGTDPATDGAAVHRYVIDADGVDSYNRLAMGLSRILTPKASLPGDPVLLEQQEHYELPSIYPWTVAVLR